MTDKLAPSADSIFEAIVLGYHEREEAIPMDLNAQVVDSFFVGAFLMLAVVATFRLIKALSRWLHGS